MGGGGGLGGLANKVLKKAVGVEKLFGTDKITGGTLDKWVGTDVMGNKAAAERQAQADRDANQRALNAQNNANILDVNQASENVVQTDAGGAAAAVDDANSNPRRRRTGNISTTLGF